jgi:hypothetical protein
MISSVFIVLYDASYFVAAYSKTKSSFYHGFLHNCSKKKKKKKTEISLLQLVPALMAISFRIQAQYSHHGLKHELQYEQAIFHNKLRSFNTVHGRFECRHAPGASIGRTRRGKQM